MPQDYKPPIKGYALARKRRETREEIMGWEGVRMQEKRLAKALQGTDAGWASQAEDVLKIKRKEAIKRMGEYRKATETKAAIAARKAKENKRK